MNTMSLICLLAQLFRQPIRIPTEPASLLWVLPICLSIALVYKSIKLEVLTPAILLREVAFLFITIIGFLIVVALCLLGIARLVGI